MQNNKIMFWEVLSVPSILPIKRSINFHELLCMRVKKYICLY